jgi:hypothetical protein
MGRGVKIRSFQGNYGNSIQGIGGYALLSLAPDTPHRWGQSFSFSNNDPLVGINPYQGGRASLKKVALYSYTLVTWLLNIIK